jgi:tRNA pseudouridine13 synthase
MMKVKRLREDFIVREVSSLPLGRGPHAVYRLDKSGLGTPEAITEVLNIWNLPRGDIHYGGLKDRHATTSQLITIFNGPRDSIKQPGFSLEYLGQSSRSMTAGDIEANEFQVTIRAITEANAIRFAQVALGSGESTKLCIPNYFDDQRFGSLGDSGQFIAQPWCLGDYERALFLAIAEANPHDRSDDREQKQILRDHWGQWQICKDRLERSHRRSIVTYLVDHPTGFKKAVALIRQDLRGIYVAAFQAKLWNEVVVLYLQKLLPDAEFLTAYGTGGKLLFPLNASPLQLERMSTEQIPLPSGRKTEWTPQIAKLLDIVLEEFGLLRHKLRFSYPRDVFFARGARDLILAPQELKCSIADDELSESNERKLTLQFRLRPGQYATMLLKAIEMLAAR